MGQGGDGEDRLLVKTLLKYKLNKLALSRSLVAVAEPK